MRRATLDESIQNGSSLLNRRVAGHDRCLRASSEHYRTAKAINSRAIQSDLRTKLKFRKVLLTTFQFCENMYSFIIRVSGLLG